MYYAGPALYAAGRNKQPISIATTFRPFLEILYASIEETVNLGVLKGDQLVFIDGIEGKQNLRVGLRTGMRFPAASTAGGQAILKAQEAGYPAAPVVTYSVDKAENGVTAIGLALGRFNRHEIAITISIPTSRVTPDRRKRLERELRQLYSRVRESLLQ